MSDSDDDGSYGPQLPGENKSPKSSKLSPDKKVEKRVIGPALPPGFVTQEPEDKDDNVSQEEDDDQVIGPLPPGSQEDLKREYEPFIPTTSEPKNKREEWMTVIPDKVEKKLGFTSVTSFSKRPVGPVGPVGPPPTSSSQSRDNELKDALKEFTEKKRQSSLMDLHNDKIKKKAKLEEKKGVRQPLDFDPEKDLHVRNFDSKQTQSVIEKSKLLNTRFSSGGSKFL